MTLRADLHDLRTFQMLGSNRRVCALNAPERIDVRQAGTMAAFTSDTALFTGAKGIRLAVAANAPLFEGWTQHPAELIFTITRFFQKAGR